MAITVSFDQGQYVARCGQDFVYANESHVAVAKLQRLINKGSRTHVTAPSHRTIRQMSLRSRYINRRANV